MQAVPVVPLPLNGSTPIPSGSASFNARNGSSTGNLSVSFGFFTEIGSYLMYHTFPLSDFTLYRSSGSGRGGGLSVTPAFHKAPCAKPVENGLALSERQMYSVGCSPVD